MSQQHIGCAPGNLSLTELLYAIIGACDSAASEGIDYHKALATVKRYAGEALKVEQPKPAGAMWVKDALKWSKEAIEFANKEFECPHPLIETWGNLYMNVLHAIDQALDESSTASNKERLPKEIARDAYELGLLTQAGNAVPAFEEWWGNVDESTINDAKELSFNKEAIEFAEWAGWEWRRVEGKSLWENQKTLEVIKTNALYERYKRECSASGKA